LAELGDEWLHASKTELIDALSGQPQPLHCQLLSLFLARLDLIESQIATLKDSIARALKVHHEAVLRLVEMPGLGVDSAQQIIAEIGPQASAFPSAAQPASWVGVCPGTAGERWRIQQQSVSQGQLHHAPPVEPTGARRSHERRQ
jgi:transposase